MQMQQVPEQLFVHPSSELFGLQAKPRMLLYSSILQTKKKYMQFCCEVTQEVYQQALREWDMDLAVAERTAGLKM